jgi:Vps23 core domain.
VFSSLVGSCNGFGKINIQTAEEKLAKEAQEANEVAAIARAAEEKEKQQQKLTQEARTRLTQLSRDILNKYRTSSMEGLRNDFKDQLLVEKSKNFVQDPKDGQIAYLNKRKQELEKYHEEVDGCIGKLSTFIKNVEKEKSSKSATEISVDELAVPSDIHSAQMLLLSAENAAINDALYFLDKALADNGISLEEHLRVVRKLSKQQFFSQGTFAQDWTGQGIGSHCDSECLVVVCLCIFYIYYYYNTM